MGNMIDPVTVLQCLILSTGLRIEEKHNMKAT